MINPLGLPEMAPANTRLSPGSRAACNARRRIASVTADPGRNQRAPVRCLSSAIGRHYRSYSVNANGIEAVDASRSAST